MDDHPDDDDASWPEEDDLTDSEWERSVMPETPVMVTADGNAAANGETTEQPSGSIGGGTFGGGAFAQHARHVNVAPFGGDRKPGVYKEWRKDIRVTSLAYKVPDDQMASLVYLALRSDAKALVSAQVEYEDLQGDKGLELIFSILDKEYRRADHEQADLAMRRYEVCRWRPSQAMEEYIMELKASKIELVREDPGSDISDVSMARRMLRRSGLMLNEQRLVLSAAGAKWDLPAIESALRLMYHDAHNDDRRRQQKGKGGKSKGKGKYGHRPQGTYATTAN